MKIFRKKNFTPPLSELVFLRVNANMVTNEVTNGIGEGSRTRDIYKKTLTLVKNTLIECKSHNRFGIKNDIKTALYVKARWDDLKEGPDGKKVESFVLASNTSFTKDALVYAEGTG